MDLTSRTAAAVAVTAVALVAAFGTAHAGSRTLAPGPHRATVSAPVGGHHPEGDAEAVRNGRPDLAED
ncbi:hypothetical protein ACWEN3_11385 [Streptomyces sp. NPDC004561]